MRIALYHGYELAGSGSNEYVRYLARVLARQGHEVHVICSDPAPERQDFLTRAFAWDCEGNAELLLERPGALRGTATLHQLPRTPIYPVFLTDKQRPGSVKAFTELSDAELAEYHQVICRVLKAILESVRPEILHANHLVYQPAIAMDACEEIGVPFVIFPHGSAIEYTVRRDPRYYRAAEKPLQRCSGLVCGSLEVQNRIDRLYPQLRETLRPKRHIVGVGVDTALFAPRRRSERALALQELKSPHPESGKSARQSAELCEALDRGDLEATRRYWDAYDHDLPDAGLPAIVDRIPPGGDLLLFVGGLTVGKGVQTLLAAFPAILAERPNAHVVIVGGGAYREFLEGMVHALAARNQALFAALAARGRDLDRNDQTGPLEDVLAYAASSENRRVLFAPGSELSRHVHFLGRLDHSRLRLLFPCAALAVFPSIIPEAYPLVLLESFANGVLPMVTYDSGFKDGLDSVRRDLPPYVWEKLQISASAADRIERLSRNAIDLLRILEQEDLGTQVRDLALGRFDWNIVARQMVETYQAVLARSGTHAA
ncbi:MAG: glycosyltransferase family 4 protein [Candidatus Krumholzibacteriia bacterium]